MRHAKKLLITTCVLALALVLGNTGAWRLSRLFDPSSSSDGNTPFPSQMTSIPMHTPDSGFSLSDQISTSEAMASPAHGYPSTPSHIALMTLTPMPPLVSGSPFPGQTPIGSETTPSTPETTSTPTPTPSSIHSQSPTSTPNPTSRPPSPQYPTDTPTIPPSPTPTPPQPTHTPTLVPPTPTATPVLEPGWHIMNDVSYTDERGLVRVVGELYNNTGTNQEQILATISFFDEQDIKVAEGATAPVVEVVSQGTMVPFDLEIDLQFPHVRYEIEIDGIPTGRQPRQDLQILSHTSTAGDPYRITGEIHNPGEALSTYAEIIAVLYDDVGRAVNVGYVFLPAEDLGPGQTTFFEVSIGQPYGSIASYNLTTLGF